MLQVSKEKVINELLRLAEAEPTLEVTGMVVRGEQGDRIVPMRNVALDPGRYYEWDPADMSEAWSAMEDAQEAPVLFYHSHPKGNPLPSDTDRQGALIPGIYHVILYPCQNGEWWYSVWDCTDYGRLVRSCLEQDQ